MPARHWRAAFRGLVISVLVATLGTLLVADHVYGDVTYHIEADGTLPVTVVAPREAGRPRFETLPEIPSWQTPFATRVLSRPIRIETRPFTGTARVTFSYDAATLPRSAEPARDLFVLVYVPDLGVWLPAGDEVDERGRTVTAETDHFSDWVLAATDPQQLADEQLLADRLGHSVGGMFAELLTGRQDELRCDPNRPLLQASVREPVALRPRLCEELLDDGEYQLQYVNTSGMPRIMQLPPGFERQDADRTLNSLVGRALAARHPGSAVVPDGGSLTVQFRAADVTPDTEITGDTDWSIYFVSLYRLIFEALLLDKAKGETHEAAVADRIDRAFLAADIWDCGNRMSDELKRTRDLVRTLHDTAPQCLQAVANVLGRIARFAEQNVRKNSVKSWLDRTARFLEGRLNAVLAIPKLLDLARAEMNGILQAIGTLGHALDTTVTIRPARFMSFTEASAIPDTLWSGDDDPGCRQPPAGPRPPAMPNGVCLTAVTADLDGNGKDDRLLLWRPPWSRQTAGNANSHQFGAVAYLDDDTFHLLEDSPTQWPGEQRDVELFDATRVLRLSPDRRQQVFVAILSGANTNWNVVLGITADRKLRMIDDGSPSRFGIPGGGGAGYSSDFGCVTSGGRPLLALVGSVTFWNPAGGAPLYGWTRLFYRLENDRLTYAGREGGIATDRQLPTSGSDCANDDAAHRGPEVGALHTAPHSPQQSATEFMRAVVASDRSAVSRYLAGDQADSSWADGRGVDAWTNARIATQDARSAWANAPVTCAPPTSSSGTAAADCVVAGPAGRAVHLRLLEAETDEWLVAGASA